jgi:hypothetical protein
MVGTNLFKGAFEMRNQRKAAGYCRTTVLALMPLLTFTSNAFCSGIYIPPRPPIKVECTGENCKKDESKDSSKDKKSADTN